MERFFGKAVGGYKEFHWPIDSSQQLVSQEGEERTGERRGGGE